MSTVARKSLAQCERFADLRLIPTPFLSIICVAIWAIYVPDAHRTLDYAWLVVGGALCLLYMGIAQGRLFVWMICHSRAAKSIPLELLRKLRVDLERLWQTTMFATEALMLIGSLCGLLLSKPSGNDTIAVLALLACYAAVLSFVDGTRLFRIFRGTSSSSHADPVNV